MKYYPKLDGLRGIAIIMVLIQHLGWFYFGEWGLGAYGVDMFFVLSGYLITNILIRNKNKFGDSIATFYGRRFLRIFPIYYFAILVLLLLQNTDVKENVVNLVTYTSNYFHTGGTNIVSHYWSLAVEEQFYLFWPFIVLPLRNHSNILKIVVILIVVLSYFQLTLGWVIPSKYNYHGTFPRTYMLGIGAAVAIYGLDRKINNNKFFDWFFVLLSIAMIALKNTFSEVVLPIIWAYFVLRIVSEENLAKPLIIILSKKWLQWIGVISYGIYVYHKAVAFYIVQPLCDLFYSSVAWDQVPKPFAYIGYNQYVLPFILGSIFSIIVAFLSYKYFEKPILSLKDKFYKRED